MAGNGSEDEEDAAPLVFEHKKHVAFWLRHLRMLPTVYQSGDSQRVSIAYFALSALDLLGALDDESKVPLGERRECADWIYAQQLSLEEGGGFAPGPYLRRRDDRGPPPGKGTEHSDASRRDNPGAYLQGNLAMTYTALLCLAILRDDFSRLDKPALLLHLKSLQCPDGSFAASTSQAESDCRFVFCAFAVCYMIDDWSVIDVDSAIAFLKRSQSYDAVFGQCPRQESHGGSTYCALAAMSLCGRLESLTDAEALVAWLTSRQRNDGEGGFNGRVDKPDDACYSFWCGASLSILGRHSLIDMISDVTWLLQCQASIGGISKTPEQPPDAMHAYLGLAALAMHVHDEVTAQSGEGLRTTAAKDPPQQVSVAPLPHDVPASLQSGLRKALEPRLNMSVASVAWLKQHLWSRQ